jgi:hypothetical protein
MPCRFSSLMAWKGHPKTDNVYHRHSESPPDCIFSLAQLTLCGEIGDVPLADPGGNPLVCKRRLPLVRARGGAARNVWWDHSSTAMAEVGFGNHVRVRRTEDTEALDIAGRIGEKFTGILTPLSPALRSSEMTELIT